MKITLYNIEKAIIPQFAWLPHKTKKFQCQERQYAGFGLVVFIGISNSFFIEPIEIMYFTVIERPEYDLKTKIFNEHWQLILYRKQKGSLGSFHDLTDRIYFKTKLTLNSLKFQGLDFNTALYI